MKSTPLYTLLATFLLCALTATSLSAQTMQGKNADLSQDFHISKDGTTTIGQVKVMQVAGTTLYVRYNIGLAFIRIVVKTDAQTKVFRRYGDEIRLNQIVQGDTLSVEGTIETGSDSLSLMARKLVNITNQKEIQGFKGTLSGIASTSENFILTTSNGENITHITSSSTQIRKGTRILSPAVLQIGDRILDASGTYDRATKRLDSTVVLIYTDMTKYKERNFEGTFKSASTGIPQTITFGTEGVDYTVVLPGKADILTKNRKPVSIQRFVAGDTIRIFGKIREVDEPIIDAEVVRNLSL